MNCTQAAISIIQEGIKNSIEDLEAQIEFRPEDNIVVDNIIEQLNIFISDLVLLKPFENKEFEELTEEAVTLSFKYAAIWSEQNAG